MPFIKPNNRLYHYRSFDELTKYILPEFKLRLSRITNTNDPRENKSFIFAAYTSSGIANEELEKVNEEISDILREDCKFISFSDDDSEAKYCGYEKSRMWAYYGGNHEGVCLGLDKEEFIIENQSVIDTKNLRKIDYFKLDLEQGYEFKTVNHILLEEIGREKYIKEVFRQDNLRHLYFTKNKEWESEDEIRLLHFSSNTADEFCSIRNSLKNIYLGVDFDENNLQKLIDMCPRVDIYKLEFQEVRMKPNLLYEGSKIGL